jgi:outer membrane protein assembly factor BamB
MDNPTMNHETNGAKMSPGLCFLIIILSCLLSSCLGPIRTSYPTSTPSSPPREIDQIQNFPWRERWRVKVGLLQHNYHKNAGNLTATEAGVVIVDDTWTLRFIKADTGNLRWVVELSGPVDTLVSDEDKVYAAGDAGQIVEAYQLQTGELAWKADITLPDHSGYYLNLQERGLYAYQLGQEEAIYIFDRQSGKNLDKIRILDMGQRSTNLLLLGDQEWLQANDEAIVFVRADQVVWQTNLGGVPQKFPWLHDNLSIVYFKNDRTVFDGLAGLDRSTGSLIWDRPGEFFSNFIIVDDLLYVISKEADVLVINPENGQTVGQAEFSPDTIDIAHPISAVAADRDMLYVYFGDSQELIAFEKVEGE